MAMTPLAKALYEEIGGRIAIARRHTGLSQESLAAAIGVKRTSISNLEKGRQSVPLAQLYVIARTLGKSVLELLPDHEAVEAKLPQVDVTISGTTRPFSQQQLQKVLISVNSTDTTQGGSNA